MAVAGGWACAEYSGGAVRCSARACSRPTGDSPPASTKAARYQRPGQIKLIRVGRLIPSIWIVFGSSLPSCPRTCSLVRLGRVGRVVRSGNRTPASIRQQHDPRHRPRLRKRSARQGMPGPRRAPDSDHQPALTQAHLQHHANGSRTIERKVHIHNGLARINPVRIHPTRIPAARLRAVGTLSGSRVTELAWKTCDCCYARTR